MTTNRIFSLSLLALGVMALCCADVLAQPGGGGGGGRGGRGGFGGGGGVTGLLQSEDVRAELEITDDQIADLQAMGQDMRDEMRSAFQDMRDLSPEERQDRIASLRADVEDRMNDILLPHQMARLKEIQLQQQIQRSGLQGALQGSLAEELGLTAAQQEELMTKAQELQQEMQEKIAQLRKDAEDELMQVLTPEQQAKLKSLMGSQFEMQQRNFGRGGFGGQQGRGGQQGPGGRGGQQGPGGRGGRPQGN